MDLLLDGRALPSLRSLLPVLGFLPDRQAPIGVGHCGLSFFAFGTAASFHPSPYCNHNY